MGGAASAANLTFDLSSTGADQLVVNDGKTAFNADGGKITISDLDSNTPLGSYTLVTDASGGLAVGPAATAGSDFWLGTTALSLSGGRNYVLSLVSSGTTVVLDIASSNINFYWTGAGTGLTTSGSSSWSNVSNFAIDQTGAVAQSGSLSASSNVFLTANSASHFSQTLDGNYEINSLSFTGTGTSAASNSITLASGTGSVLTIDGGNLFTDSNGNSYGVGTGLVVQPGSAGGTISANINLGNSQTWLINNSPGSALTVTGVIANGLAFDSLTKTGTGTLILANADTYNGGTIVDAGTLMLGSGGSLASTGALTVTGTSTFDLGGNNQTVSSLSDGGASTATITASTGASILTIANSGTNSFSGTITDGNTGNNGGSPSLALVIQGSSSLTLSGSNNFTGGTTLTTGTLIAANDYALGNPNSVNANGGLTLNPSSGTVTAYFTSANPSIAALNSSGAGTSNVVLGNTSGSGTSTTLNVGANGVGVSAFYGTISDLTGTKSTAIGNLNVFGGGYLELFGTNTFTGVTTITGSGGGFNSELILENALAIENSTLNYNSINPGDLLIFYGISSATLGGLEGARKSRLDQSKLRQRGIDRR